VFISPGRRPARRDRRRSAKRFHPGYRRETASAVPGVLVIRRQAYGSGYSHLKRCRAFHRQESAWRWKPVSRRIASGRSAGGMGAFIDRSPAWSDKNLAFRWNTMPRFLQFSAANRASEKQASRDADERALENGLVSAAQLRVENGVFSGFNIAGAAIRRRR